MHLTDAQRLDWLRLIRSDNVGPRTFRMLLRHCGSAGAAIEQLPDLARRGGARAVRLFRRDEAEEEFEAAAKMNVAFVALGEDGYPSRLAEIDDAPPLIAVRGKAAVLNRPMIAIVGSRNASAAGIKLAEQLGMDLGAAGLVVASGLARGIDAAAHRASVATGTVSVLAGGHARIYPPEHEPLVDALIANGAAISEMPLTYGPRGHDFPRRNRLISGLSLGVIVVEAAQKSGSLITGRMALEQNREVFAVPGSPLDPRTVGTNALIKQGATMVTEAEDVLAVLRPILGSPLGPAVSPLRQGTDKDRIGRDGFGPDFMDVDGPGGAQDTASPDARARIVALLGPTPVPVDDLIRLSGVSSTMVLVTLLELELAGRLKRQKGSRVALLD
jgi:DNA processing protein